MTRQLKHESGGRRGRETERERLLHPYNTPTITPSHSHELTLDPYPSGSLQGDTGGRAVNHGLVQAPVVKISSQSAAPLPRFQRFHNCHQHNDTVAVATVSLCLSVSVLSHTLTETIHTHAHRSIAVGTPAGSSLYEPFVRYPPPPHANTGRSTDRNSCTHTHTHTRWFWFLVSTAGPRSLSVFDPCLGPVSHSYQ